MHPDIICGLDIGGSSVRTLIGQMQRMPNRGNEKILGFSQVLIKGFSKGVVTNLGLLSDVIEEAVSKAEQAAHCKVRRLITNISGVHIRTFKSKGSVHISDRPSEITENDISRCIESAKLIAMSLDRVVIHMIPERFYIDDKVEIDEPLGLFGSKLDVDLNIITSLSSILHNITKAVNLAGYEVEEVILSGMGTALAVFDRKELEEGAVLIDVGKNFTEAALFMDGKLKDSFYFPFGSDDLTQVLQDRLRIMFEEAEELRIRYGIFTKLNREFYDDSPVLIPSLQNKEDRLASRMLDKDLSLKKNNETPGIISRQEIANMLLPKVEEIMEGVYKKIEPFLKERKRLPHISILGGVSKMDGFVERVEEIFSMPLDMGRIKNAKDFYDVNFACCLGLVRYQAYKQIEKHPGYICRVISKIRAVLSEYF